MPRVIISDELHSRLLADADPGFSETGIKRENGTWSISISDEVLDRLREVSLPGEIPSDTIDRISRGPAQ